MPAKPTDIDRLYGLEPVFEPGESVHGNELDPFIDIPCPYCGEMLLTQLDLSAGSQTYVEDCQVCCQPIQMVVRVGEGGALESVQGERMDR